MRGILRYGSPLALAGVIAVAFLLLACGDSDDEGNGGDGTAATPAEPNTMAVDADAGTSAVESVIDRGAGSEFEVAVALSEVGTEYDGYDLVLEFDAEKLEFVPTEDMGPMGNPDTVPDSWRYVNEDDSGLTLQATVTRTEDRLQGGAARQGSTSFSGQLVVITFKCQAPGEAQLHLVSEGEGASFSQTLGLAGRRLPTELQDATVTCG